MRQVLEYSEKETISLHQEIEFARDYLELEALRYGFQLAIDIGDVLKVHDIEIPALLTQPFIENAIVHAMADMGTGGKLNLRFSKQNEKLIIQIQDNGKGFDKNATKGFGLGGSTERISLINARHNQNILWDIACNDPEPGCKVTLTVPLDV
jgi:LytS/YehU family sensor histidine kinase